MKLIVNCENWRNFGKKGSFELSQNLRQLEYELHELDHELFAEGVCQLVERFDGRRALWSFKTLVRLRGNVCAMRHIAFLLTSAHLK